MSRYDYGDEIHLGKVRVYRCPFCHRKCVRALKRAPEPCECTEDLRGIPSVVEDMERYTESILGD